MNDNLVIQYEGSEIEDEITCSWRIVLPTGIYTKTLITVQEDVNKRIKLLRGAVANLEEVGSDEDVSVYELEIIGRGHDERCSWCRYFRKELKNISERSNIGFLQKYHCKFEERDHSIYDETIASRAESHDKIPKIPLDRVDFPLEKFRDEEAAEAYAKKLGGHSQGKYSDGHGQGWMLFLPKDSK